MARIKFPQNDGKNFIIHDGKKNYLYISTEEEMWF